MDKKALTEWDICTKFITPALERSGWDVVSQIREEFLLTSGRIIVRGKLHTRGTRKRADYVLFYKPNIPIAVIEVKDNNQSLGDGMQQVLSYADMLQVPFFFSTNGDGFLFHNKVTPDRWLSIHEICSHLGVSKDTVYKWIDKHTMPAHRMGRFWKFRKDDVDKWVKAGGAADRINIQNNK